MPVVLALLVGVALVGSAPSAQAAVGLKGFFAGNCKEGKETCGEGAKELDETEAKEQGELQAGAFVPFGVTDFRMLTGPIPGDPIPGQEGPASNIRNLRIQVAPGVVTNPQTVPKCSIADFTSVEVEPVNHLFLESACPATTTLGVQQVETVVPDEELGGNLVDAHLQGYAYNLEPAFGLPSEYGVALFIKEVGGHKLYSHTIIEGHVNWADLYQDYFTIHNIPPGLIESRLVFNGNKYFPTKKVQTEAMQETKFEGTPIPTTFIRNPSNCSPPGAATTSSIEVENSLGEFETKTTTSPVGAEMCNKEPFEPTLQVRPATTQSDQADGLTVEVNMPHASSPEEVDSSDLDNATVKFPEGMTLNPSAASGLEACTNTQFGKGTTNAVTCPAGSAIGHVTIDVPTLPLNSLQGNIYVGQPLSNEPQSGEEYRLFIDAESAQYGQSVRLEGKVGVNAATGQLTTAVIENPQQPFNSFVLHFNAGGHAPLANPLLCGEAKTTSVLTPYSEPGTSKTPSSAFTVDSNGEGGKCPASLPFSLTQSILTEPLTAGANTTFGLNLERPSGQQILSTITTTLPRGLVARIPSVKQCAEAEANAGTCGAASQIGTVRVALGAGGGSLELPGQVYLTGPYAGAPFGLAIVVPAEHVGPYNYGKVVTRAKVLINEETAQVKIATNPLETIRGGVPLRIKAINNLISKQGFEINPTNCSLQQTETTLTSTLGTTQTLKTPFQAEGCSSLGFQPAFSASTNANTSRANGASLNVNIGYTAGQANIASVVTTQPYALPSRLSTLQKACTQAQAETDILKCPSASKVGAATVVTPTLPGKMQGPAYIVSHGGEAFPDLDLVLEDVGVRVVLVGNTHITKGITTTTFDSNPDVPITSFSLSLPSGPYSLLSANGSFCQKPLVMPTTITGQNGKKVVQNTQIKVNGCLPITRHRVRGHKVIVSVKVPQGGRVRFSGDDLGIKTLLVRKAKTVTVTLPVTPSGLYRLRHHHILKTEVRVGFIPKLKGGSSFTSFLKVTFR